MTSRSKSDRRGYHHGDLANAVLDAALRLVEAKGADGLSMREAARAVGVDPAAVYRHYDDKGAVLAALAARGFAEMARQMETRAARASDAEERFRAIGRAYVAFAVKHPAYFRVMFGPYGAGSDGARSVEGVGETRRTPYALLLDALEELGRVRELRVRVDTAALPAWATVHGLASLMVDGAWRGGSQRERDAAVECVIDAAIAGICV